MAALGQPAHAPPAGGEHAGACPLTEVAIIGAGYAGASVAVQLVRASPTPVHITLIDPAAQPGRGLAYSTSDPDHRLNAPSFVHSLLPDDITHFSRWYRDQSLLAQDPLALEADGSLYARRADFGRYITETLRAHSGGALHGGPGGTRDRAVAPGAAPAAPVDPRGHAGSTITHRRDSVLCLQRQSQGGWTLVTDQGALTAQTVVLATGAAPAGLPPPLDAAPLQDHPALLVNPWSPDLRVRLAALPADAAVLVLGNGLTALDLLSTVLRERPGARIDVLSRRGLRPSAQGPLPPALQSLLSAQPPLDAACELPPGLLQMRLDAAVPAFLQEAPPTARGWLRALREAARQAETAGETWHSAFDAVRDTLGHSWPQLPAAERRRVLQRLRPYHDVLRFRTPPANHRAAARAEAAGQLHLHAGRLLSAQTDGTALQISWQPTGVAAGTGPLTRRFDAVINCTGTGTGAGPFAQPLWAQALSQGLVQRDASGLGLAVDRAGQALDAQGRPQFDLRALGQPTLGASGDAVGAIFIAAQAKRLVGDLLQRTPA